MATRFSFNRERDKDKIITEILTWDGPFCLPKYETEQFPVKMPDVAGVYIFCFPYRDGFLLEAAGVTKSTKQRIATHIREYKYGGYNIFDMDALSRLERLEIWHGWAESKIEENKIEFKANYEFYSKAIESQLSNYRIFIATVDDIRKRERIEAAIMLNAYTSKEPWADIAPRWMFLKGRYNHEIPIQIENKSNSIILGLPNQLEI